MFVHTGDYVEQVSNDISHSTYYTFTPRPLMDGGFYTIDEDLAYLLATTHRSLGVLEGVLLTYPERESFSELMLLKESCFNKMVDYPGFDLNSLLLDRGLGKTNEDINNIASAYQLVLDAKTHKINCDDIARYAMYGVSTKQKATTRNTQIFLSKSISNYRQYNPTAPGSIHSAMNDISKYLELDGVDALIKAAMCHYQFEIIHPYEYFNGVIGRIFVYKLLNLNTSGFSGMGYLSLSECLYHRKTEYFEKLGQTQKTGSYSEWIRFFVQTINEAAQNSIKIAKKYIEIMRAIDEKLAAHEDKKRHTTDIYNHFKNNVVSSIGQASEQLQLSFNTVTRAIKVLENLCILVQITPQSRNRLFAHANLMQLLLREQA